MSGQTPHIRLGACLLARATLFGVFTSLLGCGGGGSVVVDLRTDFLGGTEFVGVEVALGDQVQQSLATERESFHRGTRVAELRDVPAGQLMLDIALIAPSGERLAARPVLVDYASGDTLAFTVVISRDCASVSCPLADGDPALVACFGGRCVDPRCVRGDEAECPAPECEEASACSGLSDCTTLECSNGVCLSFPDDAVCEEGTTCSVERGCVESCANGIQDPDEEGVDCGGLCSDACYDCRGQSDMPVEECEALVDFYLATGGAAWLEREDWLRTSFPCSWYGVTCRSGRVRALRLRENGLSGELNASLSALTELEDLTLAHNALRGTIPASFGTWTVLNDLDLSYNELRGELPPELGGLTSLEDLELGDNQLSGELPATLGDLANLGIMSLESNSFRGTIPAEFCSLSRVRWMLLRDNELSGSIPACIGTLTELTLLSLSSNQLDGAFPAELADLPALRSLYLHGNRLTGSLPDRWTSVESLSTLWIQDNNLTGPLPSWLSDATNLGSLLLDANDFEGSIPDLSTLTSLVSVDLSRNRFDGPVPDVGASTGLENLDLRANRLSGEVPASMLSLSNLTSLWLAGNECLTADETPGLPAYLAGLDDDWNDGCE